MGVNHISNGDLLKAFRQQCSKVRFVFSEDSSTYYVKLYHKDKRLEVGGQVGRREMVWHVGRALCQAIS